MKSSVHSGKLSSVEDLWGKPGGCVKNCMELVDDNIILHHPPLTNLKSHYYIMAGICDITTKISSHKYQEVIFDNPEMKTQLLLQDLGMLSQHILKAGATPILCTIPTMHLATWNQTRIREEKTSHLNYVTEYDSMQKELDSALAHINSHIIQMNLSLGLATPLLHTSLLRNKHGKQYTLYKLLSDGCHPSEPMTLNIVKSLIKAFELNKHLH